MKIWQSSAMEEAKVLRLEVKQREEDWKVAVKFMKFGEEMIWLN